jgi:hypothetical protein
MDTAVTTDRPTRDAWLRLAINDPDHGGWRWPKRAKSRLLGFAIVLASFSRDGSNIYPTLPLLAERAGISPRQARRLRDEVIALGLFIVTGKAVHGGPRLAVSIPPWGVMDDTPTDARVTDDSESVMDDPWGVSPVTRWGVVDDTQKEQGKNNSKEPTKEQPDVSPGVMDDTLAPVPADSRSESSSQRDDLVLSSVVLSSTAKDDNAPAFDPWGPDTRTQEEKERDWEKERQRKLAESRED